MDERDQPYHKVSTLFPLLVGEEFEALKADIAANGLRHPILIHPDDGSIIDGRNRHRACIETGILPRFETWDGKGSLVALVISENVSRRHLSSSQRAFLALDVLPMLEKEAEQERRRKIAEYQSTGQTSQLIDSSNETKSTERVAELLDTNRQYVSDAKKLDKQAPDLAQMARSGNMTIPKAIRELNRANVITNLNDVAAQEVKQVEGIYDVIVIDPPWPITKIEREVRPNQVGLDYPTMSIDELAALKLPVAADCHVWLWTTHKFMPAALELLKCWGLRYVCTFTWHKSGGFQPVGLPQYNSEFALYARKGAPIFIDTKAFDTCFDAPRGGHSEKPQTFYDTVVRVTAGRRLDMFNRRAIDGFDGWGQEAV